MPTFFLAAALVILGTVLLSLYRVLWGPSIVDRIVAANIIGTKTIVIILFTGHLFNRVEFFIDIAIVYALINFVGTLGFAKYFEQKDDAKSEALE